MNRLLAIVAATAAAAAIAAAITIPAGADSAGKSGSDELATFTACMRAHGIPIPADLEGVAVKEWIGAHQDTAGLEDAFKACEPATSGPVKAPGPPPEELVACLRTKGFEPPASMDDFKRWTLQQFETSAGKEALNACGLSNEPEVKKAGDGGPCGVEKARTARKAQASRARKPKTQTTPAT